MEREKIVYNTKKFVLNSSNLPCVSVIIPSFNRPIHLQSCLNSLVEQNYEGEWNIIVVDDGSTLQYHDIIKESEKLLWQRRGVRLYYIRLNSCHGQAAARNKGACFTKANIIAFLDDDEQPTQDWIREIVKGFSYGFDIAAVGGRVINVKAPSYIQWQRRPYYQGDYIHETTYLPEGNVAFWRDVFWEIGGFDPKIKFAHEGIDLYIRMRKRGYRLLYNPSAIVYHNHSTTVKGTIRKAWFLGVNAVYIYDKHGLGNTLIRKSSRSTFLLDLLFWFTFGSVILGVAFNILKWQYSFVFGTVTLVSIIGFFGVVFLLYRPKNIQSLGILVMSLLIEKFGNIWGEIHRITGALKV